MNRIRVLHLTDTLEVGGAERVAVDLANLMPRDRYQTFLCTTRHDGPLTAMLAPDVGRLCLNRRRMFDVRAIRNLARFVREHRIQIMHAHGHALFVACLASMLPNHPCVVWHAHYGHFADRDPIGWRYAYRVLTKRVRAAITVSQPLADWCHARLRMPRNRIRYIPNFVCQAQLKATKPCLPGHPGARIACVANFRPEKDHVTLIRAMATVIKHVPRAHLLLIGDCDHTDDILGNVQQLIRQYSLERHVSMLGRRDDVADILSGCDIGVLSSSSEGLPLSLLEYGIAGLPSVATCVGQCGDVLDNGEAGLIVPPRAPDKLAEALETLLSIPERRIILGERLQRRVTEVYNAQRAVDEVSQLYGAILTECKVIQPKPNASGHGRTSVLVDRRYPG